MMNADSTTLGPHPELSGVVALDLADVQNNDLQEACTLAWENGYWIVDSEETHLGTTLFLERFDQ